MSQQNDNYIEIALTILEILQGDLNVAIAKIADHLDDEYRRLGRTGLRMPDVDQDLLLGLEILRGENLFSVTMRLVAHHSEDSPLTMCSLQDYVNDSLEFKKWLEVFEIE